MDRKRKSTSGTSLIAVSIFLFLQAFYLQSKQFTAIPYSRFEQLLNEDKIDKLWVAQNTIQGDLKAKQDGRPRQIRDDAGRTRIRRRTRQAPRHLFRDRARHLAQRHPVVGRADAAVFRPVDVRHPSLRQPAGHGGGLLSIGKSRAKVYVETDTKVTFADVAGVDEAKEELKEVVEFLRTPKQYGRLGARMPKGVLLVGPPGTGKTLLARAVAGEAGVKFFSISGSEFVEMFVGVGAARVRDLFEEARKAAPAIIFIDELDALGRARGAFPMGGNDEKEQTLNQLLVELDGFDPTIGLILLAATNRPEILDPALLRAGRFDRQVLVDRPDKRGRVDILKVHFKKAVLASDVDPEQIAALTTGFTGADLANLINEAALLATRRGADRVHLEDFTAAIERIVAGLEKRNRILNPFEHRVVAYHELGHAIVAMALPNQDPVHKVSIIPRGVGALGYTIQRPTEDRFLMTQDELENRMAVLLGGRAAEAVVFHHLSTGAADDLAKATDIARSMVMRYGMDKQLGHVTYAREKQTMLGMPTMPGAQDEAYSEETERSIDHALHDLMQRAFDRATSDSDAQSRRAGKNRADPVGEGNARKGRTGHPARASPPRSA